MKNAYKLFYIINSLFAIYIFMNNLVLYDATPDSIFIFCLLILAYVAVTIYYFLREIVPHKFDYIISSIYLLFIMFSMVLVIMIQSNYSYANTICYYNWIIYIPTLIYTLYGLLKN